MRFNVFGRNIEVERRTDRWQVYYHGNEGKKRLADDIIIPSNLTEVELLEHIADLCHEWETAANSKVMKLDN